MYPPTQIEKIIKKSILNSIKLVKWFGMAVSEGERSQWWFVNKEDEPNRRKSVNVCKKE